jgi:hypothetical protein
LLFSSSNYKLLELLVNTCIIEDLLFTVLMTSWFVRCRYCWFLSMEWNIHVGNILFLSNWDLEYTFITTPWVSNVFVLSLFLCRNYNKNILEWPFCPFNIRDRNRNIPSYINWWMWVVGFFLCACVHVLLLVCKVTVFTLVLNSTCTSHSFHRISFLAASVDIL